VSVTKCSKIRQRKSKKVKTKEDAISVVYSQSEESEEWDSKSDEDSPNKNEKPTFQNKKPFFNPFL
jgi:hypothetical protein